MAQAEIVYTFAQVFIWLCLFTSVGIMIPQVVALHKNKYADNSSIWTYWIYFLCNLVWTIYQVLFIVYRIYYDDSEAPTKAEFLLLFVQLACDIITSLLGIYLVFVKYYYLHVLKRIGKGQLEQQKNAQQKKNLSFIQSNMSLIDKQCFNIYRYYHKIYEAIITKPFKKLAPNIKLLKLIEMAKKIKKLKKLDRKTLIFYENNNKLINQFIINYQKSYPVDYKQIVKKMKITNLNLATLSYENKLRIAFIQITNLI